MTQRRADAVPLRRRRFAASWEAKWELLLPVFVVGAFVGGVATLVESAPMAALYALIVQRYIHRDLPSWKDVFRVAADCVALVGGVLLILAVAARADRLPRRRADPDAARRVDAGARRTRGSCSCSCLNVFLLLVGTLMDIFSAIVVVVPLILPLAEIYGINYVHLGIIFVANLELGFLHPPLGSEPAARVGAVQEAGARGDVGDAADARHPGDRRAAHHLRAVADAGDAALDGAGVTKLEDERANSVCSEGGLPDVAALLLDAEEQVIHRERDALRTERRRNHRPSRSVKMQHGHHGANGVPGRGIEFPHPHAPTAVALRHKVDGVALRRPHVLFFDRLILRERDPVGRRHGRGAERENDDARPVRARPFHRARPAAIGRQLAMSVETLLQVRQRRAHFARGRIDHSEFDDVADRAAAKQHGL